MKNKLLILGAKSDIGLALAYTYAQKDYDLILAARHAEKYLSSLQSDISIKFNVNVQLVDFDAEDFISHQSFYHSINVKPSEVIVLFGYMNDNEIVEKNQIEFLRTLNVNFVGAANITNIIAQDFMKKKAGTIIGISSVAGERGRQSNYIYGASKAGFSVYLDGLRNRLSLHNVHVMTVKPGFVHTKMTENLNLPKLLTVSPEYFAIKLFKASQKKKNTLYINWFWRYIMLIIKNIPEFIFKKLKI